MLKNLAFSILIILTTNVYAAFQSKSISTTTASVTFTAAGTVSISVELQNGLDGSTTGWIYWSNVTLPANWVVASSYILLHSTITDASGGIQIYTDNTASDANPKYTGSATSKSGLIDTTDTTKKLLMAWEIVDISTTSVTAGDPNTNTAWFYFKDKGNTGDDAMTNGESYITVKNTNGIQYAQGNFGATSSPDKILIEAYFANAVTPRTYKTNTLRLEAFTQ